MMTETQKGEGALPAEPYRPDPQDIETLRSRLLERGFRLELTDEERSPLLEAQFRSLDQGRGLGVVAVMGHERAEEMLRWALETGERTGGKRIVSRKTGEPIEETRGRGIQQALADILTIAVYRDSPEGQDAARRLNRRLWRGLEREYRGTPEMEAINQAFAEYLDPPPTSKLASITPEALGAVFDYLFLLKLNRRSGGL